MTKNKRGLATRRDETAGRLSALRLRRWLFLGSSFVPLDSDSFEIARKWLRSCQEGEREEVGVEPAARPRIESDEGPFQPPEELSQSWASLSSPEKPSTSGSGELVGKELRRGVESEKATD